MNTIEYLTGQFQNSAHGNLDEGLNSLRQNAFAAVTRMGIPNMKHEEWKYTRINNLFNKEYSFGTERQILWTEDVDAYRLPGHQDANELFFINGLFSL